MGGTKSILPEEQPTIDFAYACVVSLCSIPKGQTLNKSNVWVKRPGTGEIKAVDYPKVLGKIAMNDIPPNTQIRWEHIG